MLEFGLGCGFMLLVCSVTVLTLLKLGLLKNHGDVTNRFEAHRELVNGTLDLMEQRGASRLETYKRVVEADLKAKLDGMQKELEDARAGVLGIDKYLKQLEARVESVVGTAGLAGEGSQVPRDMEVIGGGAIGND